MPLKEDCKPDIYHFNINTFENVFYTMLYKTGKEVFNGKIFYNGKTLKISMLDCLIDSITDISGLTEKVVYSRGVKNEIY